MFRKDDAMLKPTDYTLAEKNTYDDSIKYRFESILPSKNPYLSTIDITYNCVKQIVIAKANPVSNDSSPLGEKMVKELVRNYTLVEQNTYGDSIKYHFESVLPMKYPYPSTIDITYNYIKQEIEAKVNPVNTSSNPLIVGLVEELVKNYISHRSEN